MATLELKPTHKPIQTTTFLSASSFDVADFISRNVTAQEIEKVISALTSRSFSRDDFAKSLDHFYVAIENAAATIADFHTKQTFLNTVYERFFQGFCVKVADTHGIVYTAAYQRSVNDVGGPPPQRDLLLPRLLSGDFRFWSEEVSKST